MINNLGFAFSIYFAIKEYFFNQDSMFSGILAALWIYLAITMKLAIHSIVL